MPLTHHPQHGTGDILIFLTGREEIERCLEELTELIPTYALIFPPSDHDAHAHPNAI